jgi:hypothetical protein
MAGLAQVKWQSRQGAAPCASPCRKRIGGFWRSLQQQLGELLGRVGEGESLASESAFVTAANFGVLRARPPDERDDQRCPAACRWST